jgi:uncharacterized DUF497 family protein
MEIVQRLKDIDFIWDGSKGKRNLVKHGVTFEDACEVFFDPFIHFLRLEIEGGEERQTSVGMTKSWRLLAVTYTLRDDFVRLISARPATGPERNAYENERAS